MADTLKSTSRRRFTFEIVIQQTTETQDAYGELDDTWSTYATVWADKIEGKGAERYSAAKETAFSPVVFMIRTDSGVTEKMRISYDSKIYDIISVDKIGRRMMNLVTELRE